MSWGVATQNGVSVSLASIVSLSCGATEFSPASLFTSGVAGAWYDPSDVLLNWRTNLLTYSQEFDNAAWTKAQTTVSANAVTAPDGTTTADKMVETAVTNVHGAYQTFTYVSGATYSASVYAKQAERSWIYLGADTSAAESVFFDLANGTVGAQGTGYVGSIQSVGDGWYRCTVTITQSTALPPNYFVVGVTTANNTTSYLGDITKGVYIWGAQLELGSTATTYQAITTPEQTYLLYDPQPVLYQDSAGTTPVTAVEQPVGLMLDKSQGLVLGSELVTNGDFSGGTTGWTAGNSATLSTTGGKLSVVNGAVSLGQGRQTITTVAGKTYKLSVTFTSVSASRGYVFVGTFAGDNSRFSAGPLTTSQTVTGYFTAAGTSTYLSIGNADNSIGLEVQFDDVTVKDIAGNHASQATSASRPILRARYNLLTYSEQFDNAAWTKTGMLAFGSGSTVNATAAPDGTTTADLLTPDTSSSTKAVRLIVTGAGANTWSFYAKANGYTKVGIWDYATSGAYAAFSLSGAGSVLDSGSGASNATIASVGNGWYRCSFTATVTGSLGFSMQVLSPSYTTGSVNSAWTPNGTDGVYLWGAMLNTGSSAGTYQRIAAATDYATAGFLPYLAFDGTDDSFVTNSVDFTATNKMSLCAGITKNSDALRAVFAHLGNLVLATFRAEAPLGSLTGYLFASTGTGPLDGAQGSGAAPATKVFTGLSDIAADICVLRLDGTQVGTNSFDQGTGNYANAPLYVGRRGDNSLFFNGRIYQLVVCGKTLSASELASTEAYVNSKTGAY